MCIFESGICRVAYKPPVFSPQAASLPMSIIIVGVGPAEFDGKCVCVCVCVWGGALQSIYNQYNRGALSLLSLLRCENSDIPHSPQSSIIPILLGNISHVSLCLPCTCISIAASCFSPPTTPASTCRLRRGGYKYFLITSIISM